MFESLYSLSWRKVSLALRNTRNVFAREHPLSVFQAIFNHAASAVGGADQLVFFFHPQQHLPARINKHSLYPLEVVFPQADPGTIESLLTALDKHLVDPRYNFRMEDIGPIQARTLEALEQEAGGLFRDAKEVCLDFLTPFPFSRVKDPERRWLIDKQDLARSFANRLKRYFGVELAADSAWADIKVLPYYWDYRQHRHHAKSNKGQQFIHGCAGPLYLKGVIAPLLPLLLICSEIHIGRRQAAGQGYYRLDWDRKFFDERLLEPELFLRVAEKIKRDSDEDNAKSERDDPELVLRLHGEVATGAYRAGPCRGYAVDKNSGGPRLVAELERGDYLVQRALLEVLEPVLDRMFESSSVGFREGRSRRNALRLLAQAARGGLEWVVESDMESFFDQVDWTILRDRLDACLPDGDELTKRLLESCITSDMVIKDKRVKRSKGLLQGSPLLPLLSNLYLDPFDEEMERLGHTMVRYGDDFLVLVRDRKEGERTLADIARILAGLNLKIKEEKTAISPLAGGVSFLGFDMGADLEEELIDRATLRKPLLIRSLYAFIGLDKDSIVIRKDRQPLARFPIRRVGELIVFGSNSLSTRLVMKCARERIPIAFCTAMGHHLSTMAPDSRKWYRVAGRQDARFSALAEKDKAGLSAALLEAKVGAYLAWLRGKREIDAEGLRSDTAGLLAKAAGSDRVEAVRGYEAAAARLIFQRVKSLVKVPGFAGRPREPRKKADFFNSLLDLAYHLLFCRLNVLVRVSGLNPYLGFLHSQRDNYESLVCDLQEPFRARMDRMVVKLINRQVFKASDFAQQANGGYRLGQKGFKRFLEVFERELSLRLAPDPSYLLKQMDFQVQMIKAWALGRTSKIIPGRVDHA
jgi:CRISPR-associated endonuclease Cas1